MEGREERVGECAMGGGRHCGIHENLVILCK